MNLTPMSTGAFKKQGYVQSRNRDTGLENNCKRVKRDGMDWESGIDTHTLLIVGTK